MIAISSMPLESWVSRATFGRQRADVDGLEAGLVDQDRHFDAGALRQVGDEAACWARCR